jgi:MFS family permease
MYQIENSGDLLKNRREHWRSRWLWLSVGRNVFFLGLTSLLTDISAEMVSVTLPLYLLFGLRLAPLQFGLIDGLYQGAAVLVRVVSGVLADRWRQPKALAATGYAFSAVCKAALLAVGGSWLALSGVVILDRVGKGIRTAPRDSLIASSTNAERLATAFGVHRAMDTAGAMLGPLVAAGLLALAPDAYDAVFVVSLCFALVGLAIIVLLVENSVQPVSTTTSPAVDWRAIGQLLAQPKFRALVLVSSGLALTTLSDNFIYLALRRNFGFGLGLFPLLYVATALIYMALAIPIGRLADRVGRGRMFVMGYAFLALVYGLTLMPGLPPLAGWGSLIVLGLYYAATEGVLMARASELLPATLRTTGLAVLTTGTGLARLLASFAYGAFWGWWGPETATTTFLAGLGLMLGLAALTLFRAGQRKTMTDDSRA